jgi:hypothetical protein
MNQIDDERYIIEIVEQITIICKPETNIVRDDAPNYIYMVGGFNPSEQY